MGVRDRGVSDCGNKSEVSGMKSVLEKEVLEKYGDIDPCVYMNDVLATIDREKTYAQRKQFTLEQAFEHLRRMIYALQVL